MKKIVILFIVALLAIAVFKYLYKNGNIQNTGKSDNNKIQVVASFYPMYFFAREIGGEKAEVINLTPAGVEPHEYEPTAKDMAKIIGSNMLILNGGKLETWGEKINNQLNDSKVLTVIAGEDLYNNTIKDPHIWLDAVLAKKEADKIEQGFEKLESGSAEYFRKNASELKAKLDQLDNEYKKGLESCRLKDFITSHTAFGYLAERYGLNQIAISGISPNDEPSSNKLAEITDLVKKKNIKVIFFESLASPKLSDTIANEIEAKTLVLDPLEGLTDEELKAGKNYFTKMEENLTNLKIALECTK